MGSFDRIMFNKIYTPTLMTYWNLNNVVRAGIHILQYILEQTYCLFTGFFVVNCTIETSFRKLTGVIL